MLVASLKYPYHPKKIFTVFELRSYNQLIPMAIMEDKKYHSITQVYETLLLAPNTVRKWEKTCELLKPSAIGYLAIRYIEPRTFTYFRISW